MLACITMAFRYHLPGFSSNKVIKLSILRFAVRTKNICHKETSPLIRKIILIYLWLRGISTSLHKQNYTNSTHGKDRFTILQLPSRTR